MTQEEKSSSASNEMTVLVRAANCWRSWGIRISDLDSNEDSEFDIWKRVLSTLEKDVPEINNWIVDPLTKYYNGDMQVCKSAYTKEELQNFSSCIKSQDLLFYIIPSTYHMQKTAGGQEMPLFCRLQIEAEYPSLWFLHKTDVKQDKNYFDQLKIDVSRAVEQSKQLNRSREVIPELKNNGIYRHMTNSSETVKAKQNCYEVTSNLLDTYLCQGNQNWVIRTNGSVNNETALRKPFSFWSPPQTVEKKILAEEEEETKEVIKKEVTFGQDTFVENKEPTEVVEAQPQTQTTKKTNSLHTFLPSMPESLYKAKETIKKEFGKLKKGLTGLTFFKWLAHRQTGDTTEDDVSTALYIALAIIALVIIGVIIVSVVLVVQKNKRKVTEMRLLEQEKLVKSQPQVSVQTENEIKILPFPKQKIEGTNIHDHFYKFASTAQDSDYLSDDDNSDDEIAQRPEGSAIDKIIAAQNTHFKDAERTEYTGRDMREDSKLTSNFFHKTTTAPKDIEKTLGFPSSTNLKKPNCPDGECGYPKQKTVTISL